MPSVVEKIVLALGLDTTDFKKGMADAHKNASDAEKAYENLGNKWASTIKSVVMNVAGPVTAGMALFKSITGYAGQVGEVARLTGAYSTQLEDWRKKRAMLSRVTSEDIELYKKSRETVTGFQIAMDDLSAKIARNFSPALKFGIELLEKLTKWIDKHSNDLARAFTIAAGVITAVFLPSLIKMAAALMMNPLTWIVAAIGALVLIIDDLVVYMRGGKSELASFWAQFGTGEELAKKAGAVIDWVKNLIKEYRQYIIYAVAAGAAFMAGLGTIIIVARTFISIFSGIASVVGVVVKVFTTIGGIIGTAMNLAVAGVGKLIAAARLLFTVVKANPIILILTAIIGVVYLFWRAWNAGGGTVSGMLNVLRNALKSLTDHLGPLGDAVLAVFDLFASFVENAIAVVQQVIAAFSEWLNAVEAAGGIWEWLSAKISQICDAIAGYFSELVDSVSAWFGGIADSVGGAFGGLIDVVSEAWTSITDGAAAAWSAITDGVSAAWSAIDDAIGGALSSALDTIAGWISSVLDFFAGLFGSLAGGFADAFVQIWEVISGWLDALPEPFKNVFNSIVDFIKNLFQSAWEWIKSIFDPSELLDGVADKVKSVGNSIKSFFGFGDDDDEEGSGDQETQQINQAANAQAPTQAAAQEPAQADEQATGLDRERQLEAEGIHPNYGHSRDEGLQFVDEEETEPEPLSNYSTNTRDGFVIVDEEAEQSDGGQQLEFEPLHPKYGHSRDEGLQFADEEEEAPLPTSTPLQQTAQQLQNPLPASAPSAQAVNSSYYTNTSNNNTYNQQQSSSSMNQTNNITINAPGGDPNAIKSAINQSMAQQKSSYNNDVMAVENGVRT